MKRFATVLTVAAAIMFLSNCSSMSDSQAPNPYPDARDRYSSDNSYNRFACRSYNYDPRYCH